MTTAAGSAASGSSARASARRDRRPAVERDAVDEAEVRHARADGARRSTARCRRRCRDRRCRRVRYGARRARSTTRSACARASIGRSIGRSLRPKPRRSSTTRRWPGGMSGTTSLQRWPDVGKSVDEHDGIAGAARAGGVVVDPRAGEIEKLTAHASARSHGGGKMRRVGRTRRPPAKAKRAVTIVTARAVFSELRWNARRELRAPPRRPLRRTPP